MPWKKIIIALLLIVFGSIAYFFLMFSSVTLVWIVSAISHLILSILFVLKNYKKSFIIIIIFLLLLQSIIFFISFPKCDLHYKGGWVTACDCIGLKKVFLGSSQCIGKRDKCYKFNEDEGIQWTSSYSKKIEIPCSDVDMMPPN